MATTDGCENPACDVHGNDEPTQAERDSVTSKHNDHICTDECPPNAEWRGATVGDSEHLVKVAGVLDTLNAEQVPHAVPADELERLIVAIDQQYAVEDLGYAGDARIVNVRHKVTGEYIMTATLTTSW
jgi:hypothetical protein